MATPGVTCAKCGGRFTPQDLDLSRRIQAKAHPDTPWKPPRVCFDCVTMTILSWPDEEQPPPGESEEG